MMNKEPDKNGKNLIFVWSDESCFIFTACGCGLRFEFVVDKKNCNFLLTTIINMKINNTNKINVGFIRNK